MYMFRKQSGGRARLGPRPAVTLPPWFTKQSYKLLPNHGDAEKWFASKKKNFTIGRSNTSSEIDLGLKYLVKESNLNGSDGRRDGDISGHEGPGDDGPQPPSEKPAASGWVPTWNATAPSQLPPFTRQLVVLKNNCTLGLDKPARQFFFCVLPMSCRQLYWLLLILLIFILVRLRKYSMYPFGVTRSVLRICVSITVTMLLLALVCEILLHHQVLQTDATARMHPADNGEIDAYLERVQAQLSKISSILVFPYKGKATTVGAISREVHRHIDRLVSDNDRVITDCRSEEETFHVRTPFLETFLKYEWLHFLYSATYWPVMVIILATVASGRCYVSATIFGATICCLSAVALVAKAMALADCCQHPGNFTKRISVGYHLTAEDTHLRAEYNAVCRAWFARFELRLERYEKRYLYAAREIWKYRLRAQSADDTRYIEDMSNRVRNIALRDVPRLRQLLPPRCRFKFEHPAGNGTLTAAPTTAGKQPSNSAPTRPTTVAMPYYDKEIAGPIYLPPNDTIVRQLCARDANLKWIVAQIMLMVMAGTLIILWLLIRMLSMQPESESRRFYLDRPCPYNADKKEPEISAFPMEKITVRRSRYRTARTRHTSRSYVFTVSTTTANYYKRCRSTQYCRKKTVKRRTFSSDSPVASESHVQQHCGLKAVVCTKLRPPLDPVLSQKLENLLKCSEKGSEEKCENLKVRCPYISSDCRHKPRLPDVTENEDRQRAPSQTSQERLPPCTPKPSETKLARPKSKFKLPKFPSRPKLPNLRSKPKLPKQSSRPKLFSRSKAPCDPIYHGNDPPCSTEKKSPKKTSKFKLSKLLSRSKLPKPPSSSKLAVKKSPPKQQPKQTKPIQDSPKQQKVIQQLDEESRNSLKECIKRLKESIEQYDANLTQYKSVSTNNSPQDSLCSPHRCQTTVCPKKICRKTTCTKPNCKSRKVVPKSSSCMMPCYQEPEMLCTSITSTCPKKKNKCKRSCKHRFCRPVKKCPSRVSKCSSKNSRCSSRMSRCSATSRCSSKSSRCSAISRCHKPPVCSPNISVCSIRHSPCTRTPVFPKITRCSPKISRCSPKISKCSPRHSRCRPKSSCTPKTPTCSPKISKCYQKISRCYPKISRCLPRTPACSPKLSSCTPYPQPCAPKRNSCGSCSVRRNPVPNCSNDSRSTCQDFLRTKCVPSCTTYGFSKTRCIGTPKKSCKASRPPPPPLCQSQWTPSLGHLCVEARHSSCQRPPSCKKQWKPQCRAPCEEGWPSSCRPPQFCVEERHHSCGMHHPCHNPWERSCRPPPSCTDEQSSSGRHSHSCMRHWGNSCRRHCGHDWHSSCRPHHHCVKRHSSCRKRECCSEKRRHSHRKPDSRMEKRQSSSDELEPQVQKRHSSQRSSDSRIVKDNSSSSSPTPKSPPSLSKKQRKIPFLPFTTCKKRDPPCKQSPFCRKQTSSRPEPKDDPPSPREKKRNKTQASPDQSPTCSIELDQKDMSAPSLDQKDISLLSLESNNIAPAASKPPKLKYICSNKVSSDPKASEAEKTKLVSPQTSQSKFEARYISSHFSLTKTIHSYIIPRPRKVVHKRCKTNRGSRQYYKDSFYNPESISPDMSLTKCIYSNLPSPVRTKPQAPNWFPKSNHVSPSISIGSFKSEVEPSSHESLTKCLYSNLIPEDVITRETRWNQRSKHLDPSISLQSSNPYEYESPQMSVKEFAYPTLMTRSKRLKADPWPGKAKRVFPFVPGWPCKAKRLYPCLPWRS